ncbi:hypothetical protein D3C85_1221220 [compost metagenome]
MPRGQHHAHGPAHRVADDGGLVQAVFADVAGDFFGHRGGDGAGRIGLGRGAGEALNMDAVNPPAHAVLRDQVIHGPLPDFGRGAEAGNEDDVAPIRVAVDRDMDAVGREGGVGMALGVVDVTVLGQGGCAQQQGGGQGDAGGSDHGVSPRRF